MEERKIKAWLRDEFSALGSNRHSYVDNLIDELVKAIMDDNKQRFFDLLLYTISKAYKSEYLCDELLDELVVQACIRIYEEGGF